MMKHSVILVNYNGGKYLEEAIQSILAQQDAEFELILVDDCSTDNSLEIVRGFKLTHPNKVQILVHDRNRGQGAGFNSGFSLVTGELVSFIDSDDIWYPNKLHAMEQLHASNPDAVLLHHNLHLMRGHEIEQQLIVDLMVMGDLAGRIEKYQTPLDHWPRFAPTSGLTFPSKVLSRMLPCPEVRFCADMYPTFAAVLMGPVVADYRAFGAYRAHSANNYHGKADFDLWEFFEKEIMPSFRVYCEGTELVNVIDIANMAMNKRRGRRGILDRIVDISPRVLWRRLCKALAARKGS
jgi:glycosyltransferase involved in cell wall biosynthesis